LPQFRTIYLQKKTKKLLSPTRRYIFFCYGSPLDITLIKLSSMKNETALPHTLDPLTLPHRVTYWQQSLLFNHPVPLVVQAHLRSTDVEIIDPFLLLAHYPYAAYVYKTLLALAALATSATSSGNSPRLELQIGYAALTRHIREHYEANLNKRALQRALKILEHFCYIERITKAHSGTEATTYALRDPRAVIEMLAQAGCTHYRMLRGGRVQLICARPLIPPHEVLR
jgi:hypothetical protein